MGDSFVSNEKDITFYHTIYGLVWIPYCAFVLLPTTGILSSIYLTIMYVPQPTELNCKRQLLDINKCRLVPYNKNKTNFQHRRFSFELEEIKNNFKQFDTHQT